MIFYVRWAVAALGTAMDGATQEWLYIASSEGTTGGMGGGEWSVGKYSTICRSFAGSCLSAYRLHRLHRLPSCAFNNCF